MANREVGMSVRFSHSCQPDVKVNLNTCPTWAAAYSLVGEALGWLQRPEASCQGRQDLPDQNDLEVRYFTLGKAKGEGEADKELADLMTRSWNAGA